MDTGNIIISKRGRRDVNRKADLQGAKTGCTLNLTNQRQCYTPTEKRRRVSSVILKRTRGCVDTGKCYGDDERRVEDKRESGIEVITSAG